MATGSSSLRPTPRFPSEYVLLEHFLSEIDRALESKIAVYLRAGPAGHGGWPLYIGMALWPTAGTVG